MDTVTQMLFGATLAQAGFRRRLGRRAVAAGAAIALIPDLDIAVRWVSGDFAYWVHHRGLTHSLFFGAVVGPILGLLYWRFASQKGADGHRRSEDRSAWMWLSVLALLTHPILDIFTSYGTQLLYPISRHRFAIDALPIIDPVYSGLLVLALLVGLFAPRRPGLAQAAGASALLAVTVYTVIAWGLNEEVRAVGRRSFAETYGTGAEITAYPLIFQPYYRRVLATTGDSAYVGYYSVLAPRPIEWTEFRSQENAAITALRDSEGGRILDWFAMGKVLWRQAPGSAETPARVEGFDLRYGMAGMEPSFWGVGAATNGDALAGPPEIFALPRSADRAAFADYGRRIFGN